MPYFAYTGYDAKGKSTKGTVEAGSSIQAVDKLTKQGLTRAFEPVGCSECHNTGYRGRVGLYEQFVINEEIQEAFVGGAPASKLREIARKSGFKTLWEIGLSAVQSGLTSPDELARVAGED